MTAETTLAEYLLKLFEGTLVLDSRGAQAHFPPGCLIPEETMGFTILREFEMDQLHKSIRTLYELEGYAVRTHGRNMRLIQDGETKFTVPITITGRSMMISVSELA